MLFGDRLKILREEKEITQKQLALIINISDRVIGYYESNNRFPKDESILKKLADYFDCSVDYLIGKSNIRNPYGEINNSINNNIVNLSEFPPEAIEQIKEYIDFIKQKYTKNRPGK